jgi:hypothetical protein
MKTAPLKFAILVVLFGGVFFLQREIDEAKAQLIKDPGYHLRPPKSSIMKALSLGHETLVADIYWMRAIQYYANMTELGRIPEDLYYLSDFITDLDPNFEYAYYSTGLVLTMENGNHNHIRTILEKGKKHIPKSWRIPFQLGIALYFLMNNYEEAAQNLDDASMNKGWQPYAFLAARIRAEGGNPMLSIKFLQSQFEQTKEPYWRKKIEQHIQELWVSVHLQFLNKKLNAYHQKTGKFAVSWQELFEAGVMNSSEMPREPFGGKYVIDSETYQADTTTDHKLFVYRPPIRMF